MCKPGTLSIVLNTTGQCRSQLISVRLDKSTQNQQEVCSVSDQTRTYTIPKIILEEGTSNGHFPIQALIMPCVHLLSLFYIIYSIK